ncbi:MAG: hypothetical protein K2L57_04870 [Muribaculaceae bacterium]|nr:hypothetical protein [Muribaculaceae bacterium]
MPMVHDSSYLSSPEVVSGQSGYPKSATLNFIRQFARTCVAVQGCALGSMILN